MSQKCLMKWMAALPMISVWSQDNQLVRGQLATHQGLELPCSKRGVIFPTHTRANQV